MIALFAANATGNTVLSLDEPGVDTDQTNDFTARLRSAPFDQGPASGFGTLRRVAQAVAVSGDVTLTLMPIGDGADFTGQKVTLELDPVDGPEQLAEAEFFVPATRYGVEIAVTEHEGETELGESDQWIVPRRMSRRG